MNERTKKNKAVALRYNNEKDPAPRLVAKGSGVIAEKIIEAALKAGVPVQEDPELVALLMKLDIDRIIPPEMYVAVAEILAFIYKVNSKVKKTI